MNKIFFKGQIECFFCESLVSGSEVYYDMQRKVYLCKKCFGIVSKDREITVVGDKD